MSSRVEMSNGFLRFEASELFFRYADTSTYTIHMACLSGPFQLGRRGMGDRREKYGKMMACWNFPVREESGRHVVVVVVFNAR